MADVAALRSQLERVTKRAELAVATANWRDAHALAGEAVRLEEALAAALAAPAAPAAGGGAPPAARNIVGRARVNDGSQPEDS